MAKPEALTEWKKEVTTYLNKIGVVSMRTLGRYLGLPKSTMRSKEDLTASILALLSGERKPEERSKRGAPVKETFVDPVILANLEELNFKKATFEADLAEQHARESDGDSIISFGEDFSSSVLFMHSKKQDIPFYDRAVFTGELTTLLGVFCVKIIAPQELLGEKAVIATKKVSDTCARVGDRVSFHAKKFTDYYVVTDVLSVNKVLPGSILENFERAPVEYPCEKLIPFEPGDNPLLKYFITLFPVGKGQRVIVSGAPKSGKSTLLREAVHAAIKRNDGMKITISLCEQSPESVTEWQLEFPAADIYASDYYDDPEEQIAQAERALKRAKEYVCDGCNSLFVIDDLNSLARAFNETDRSAGGRVLDGGLESKTVHYMKRILGTARKLKSSVSLTAMGALCSDTGSPFDAVLSRELLGVSTATWQLSGVFRRDKGSQPDYAASHVDNEDKFLTREEQIMLSRLYEAGAERVFEDGKENLLKESNSQYDFLNRLRSR